MVHMLMQHFRDDQSNARVRDVKMFFVLFGMEADFNIPGNLAALFHHDPFEPDMLANVDIRQNNRIFNNTVFPYLYIGKQE